MSESVLGIGHLGFAGQANEAEWEREVPSAFVRPHAGAWNAEKFAREQIRGLVRMVFSASVPRPVRQVVFCAVDASTDVRGLCMSVAEILALETLGDIAVLGGYAQMARDEIHGPDFAGRMEKNCGTPLHQAATHVRSNVWVLPANHRPVDCTPDSAAHSYLGEIRREFEYSIVAALSSEESGEALSMAQFADGIILVLSAKYTRRAAARKIKERLEQANVRLLGTVLGDREFPIPAGIYRRL